MSYWHGYCQKRFLRITKRIVIARWRWAHPEERQIEMKKLIVAGAAMLLLAGCAKRPEEILAEPIAADPYMQMDCSSLGSVKAQKDAELRRLEAVQMKTAQRDAASMSILHIPLASWQGHDVGPQLARAKGEAQAVNAAYQSKGCTGTVIMPAANTPSGTVQAPQGVKTTISNDNSGVTVIQ
jgi:hypothetical protein